MSRFRQMTTSQRLCCVMCVSHPLAAVLRLVLGLWPFVVFPLALSLHWYLGLYVAAAGFVAFLLTGAESYRLFGAARYGYGGNPDDELGSALYYEQAAQAGLGSGPRQRPSGLAERRSA